jgi:hypothetical protein
MGSDLYISIETAHHPDAPDDEWSHLWEGPSAALARGDVAAAFGSCADRETDPRTGYLTSEEIVAMRESPFWTCPWLNDEPYWVRLVSGQDFCDIVHEQHWKTLRGQGALRELQAFVALITSLRSNALNVRVWCWESQ